MSFYIVYRISHVILKAEPENTNPEEENSIVLVELVVVHDGQCDLPSSDAYMRRRMQTDDCSMPIGDGMMKPRPGSIQTEHKYTADDIEPLGSSL